MARRKSAKRRRTEAEAEAAREAAEARMRQRTARDSPYFQVMEKLLELLAEFPNNAHGIFDLTIQEDGWIYRCEIQDRLHNSGRMTLHWGRL